MRLAQAANVFLSYIYHILIPASVTHDLSDLLKSLCWEIGRLTRVLFLPSHLQIHCSKLIPSCEADQGCCLSSCCFPSSLYHTDLSPPNLLPPHSLLYPSLQIHQAFPGNPQVTLDRGAGGLTSEISFSLLFYKSNHSVSHQSLWKTACYPLPLLSAPISSKSYRSLPLNLPLTHPVSPALRPAGNPWGPEPCLLERQVS